MIKTYQKWHALKFFTNAKLFRPKEIRAGQVWWCMVGENIGYEVDGKGEKFLRPVLIAKKYGRDTFLGLPLTSKIKEPAPYYYILPEELGLGTILLSQGRSYDTARLVRKINTISKRLLRDIMDTYVKYLESDINTEPSADGSDNAACD